MSIVHACAAEAEGPVEVSIGVVAGDEDVLASVGGEGERPRPRVYVHRPLEIARYDHVPGPVHAQSKPAIVDRAPEVEGPIEVSACVVADDEDVEVPVGGEGERPRPRVHVHGALKSARYDHVSRSVRRHLIAAIVAQGTAEAEGPVEVSVDVVADHEDVLASVGGEGERPRPRVHVHRPLEIARYDHVPRCVGCDPDPNVVEGVPEAESPVEVSVCIVADDEDIQAPVGGEGKRPRPRVHVHGALKVARYHDVPGSIRCGSKAVVAEGTPKAESPLKGREARLCSPLRSPKEEEQTQEE